MIDLTPQDKKCAFGASCPGVFKLEPQDLTPEHLRCGGGLCPAVVAHDGDLVIIGKRADALAEELGKGVGPDEYPIVISPDYFENVLCQADGSAKGEVPSLRSSDERSAEAFKPCVVEYDEAGFTEMVLEDTFTVYRHDPGSGIELGYNGVGQLVAIRLPGLLCNSAGEEVSPAVPQPQDD